MTLVAAAFETCHNRISRDQGRVDRTTAEHVKLLERVQQDVSMAVKLKWKPAAAPLSRSGRRGAVALISLGRRVAMIIAINRWRGSIMAGVAAPIRKQLR